MRGLDTNILVRLVTRDDPAQAAAAFALLAAAETQGESFYVSTPVLCELVWTLGGPRYRLDRGEIVAVLDTVLGTPLFELQDRQLVASALDDYRGGIGGFADHLIAWLDRRAGCTTTLTFDADLAALPGFDALPA